MIKGKLIPRTKILVIYGLLPLFFITFLLVSPAGGLQADIFHLDYVSSNSDQSPIANHQYQAESPSLEEQEWVRLGGPLGGLGYDIRMDPRNPDVMYVTDAMAGAHKSLDGGLTWFPINEGIDLRGGFTGDLLPVFCLTIDPNNPDTIWLGLQGLGGVYRSDDGGMNWQRRATGIDSDGLTIRGITIEPGNSDVIYVAGEVPSFRWAGKNDWGKMFDRTKGIVYKSVDGGLSWGSIWRGDNLARYVWIDPRDHNTLYVSTGIYDRESALTNVEENEPGGVGVIKSSDGGGNWKVLNEQVGLTGLFVGSLFMHPENPDVLLAGAGHDYWSHAWDQGGASFTPAGVWLTTDGGLSWDQVLSDDYLISSVEFCINNPSIAYAAGVFNFYRSVDGGISWQNIIKEENRTWGPPGIVTGFPIDLQCDPRDPDRVFVNNYGGGNFITIDGGLTWESASQGYTGAMMRKIMVDQTNPALVYTGGRSGLFRSNNGGKTWVGLAHPPANKTEINAFAISPSDSDLVLNAAWDIGNLVRSTDGGDSWKVIKALNAAHQHQYLDLVFSSADTQIVYATRGHVNCIMDKNTCNNPGDGFYWSKDAGLTWQRSTDSSLDGLNVKSIAVHPIDPHIVYAGTMGNGVFKSDDGGGNWGLLGLEGRFVYDLLLQPGNPEILLAGMQNGVSRSEDGGQTWQNSNTGLDPNAAVRSLVFDPDNPTRVWLADLFSGVYLSNDSGHTWVRVNQGLTNRAVNDLAISGDGRTLYAATEGGGIFRLSLLGQEDFDALAPQPTPIPTDKPGPETTTSSSEIEPTSIPNDNAPSDSQAGTSSDSQPETQSQPTETVSSPSIPCLGATILPVAMLSMISLIKGKKRSDLY